MHVIKDQEELMGFLKSAEEYRAQKIAQFRAELEKAQSSASVWQSNIIEWERLIPADVMCRFGADIEEQKRRTEYESECDEEDNRSKERQAAFERAVSQAKGSGKGLLLNDFGNKKLLMLLIYCSVIGMYVVGDFVKFHLGLHGEIVALLSVVVGAVLGIFLGIVIFRENFIEFPNDHPKR